MTQTSVVARRRQLGPEARLEYAAAGSALAGHEVTDPVLLAILRRVAYEEITADEAVVEIRRHIEG